jgi:hypothetical protein
VIYYCGTRLMLLHDEGYLLVLENMITQYPYSNIRRSVPELPKSRTWRYSKHNRLVPLVLSDTYQIPSGLSVLAPLYTD